MFKAFSKRLLRRIGSHLAPPLNEQDLALAMQRLATSASAQYILEHMPHVQSVSNWREVHDRAWTSTNLTGGLILEFGVFQGRTIRHIAGKTSDIIHGFDSFTGLPSLWRDGYPAGVFEVNSLPDVPTNVTLHKGLFEDSLPTFLLESAPDDRPVRYLHVDCDLYSSTNTVLSLLQSRIVPGSVIVFDEYFNYPGWERGEYRSFQEFVRRTGLTYEYLTYNRFHEQVAVIIRE